MRFGQNATCTNKVPTSYSTNFAGSSGTLSEGGIWVLGGSTGLDWTNPQIDGSGKVYGSQSPGSANYDDSVACLDRTKFVIGANHSIQATIYNDGSLSGNTFEVELLLRCTFGAHSMTAYECNLAFDNQYAQVVKLPGPRGTVDGDFIRIFDGTGPYAPQTGDILDASISGNTLVFGITRSGSRTQICSVDIRFDKNSNPVSTYDTGMPGLGFWHSNAAHYGFTSWSCARLP